MRALVVCADGGRPDAPIPVAYARTSAGVIASGVFSSLSKKYRSMPSYDCTVRWEPERRSFSARKDCSARSHRSRVAGDVTAVPCEAREERAGRRRVRRFRRTRGGWSERPASPAAWIEWLGD